MGNIANIVELKYYGVPSGIITVLQKKINDTENLIALKNNRVSELKNSDNPLVNFISWSKTPILGLNNAQLVFGVSGGAFDLPNFDGLAPKSSWLNGIARFNRFYNYWSNHPDKSLRTFEIKTYRTGADPLLQDVNGEMWKINNVSRLTTDLDIIDLPTNYYAGGVITSSMYTELRNKILQFGESWNKVRAYVLSTPLGAVINKGQLGGVQFAKDEEDKWTASLNELDSAYADYVNTINTLGREIIELTTLLNGYKAEYKTEYLKYSIEIKIAFAEDENITGYTTTFEAIKTAFNNGNFEEANKLLTTYENSELAEKVIEFKNTENLAQIENESENSKLQLELENQRDILLGEKKFSSYMFLGVVLFVLLIGYFVLNNNSK